MWLLLLMAGHLRLHLPTIVKLSLSWQFCQGLLYVVV
ncbi:hypothetical protein GLYMA_17G182333v4 [Glycine max]|nr:hypothetical protein GLYMA_17G182333v4 [Glycine max]KAH1119016.1 hypothetical protein GYH30_047700 [Glycine max]